MMVFILAVAVTILAACGSDSGNSSTASSPAPVNPAVIAGPDVNSNGVRDDIDSKITGYPLGVDQKQSVTQFARSVQSTILASSDQDSAYNNAVEIFRAEQCMAQRMPTDFSKYVDDIESSTLNTDERVQAYIQFEEKIAGAVFTENIGSVCR